MPGGQTMLHHNPNILPGPAPCLGRGGFCVVLLSIRLAPGSAAAVPCLAVSARACARLAVGPQLACGLSDSAFPVSLD